MESATKQDLAQLKEEVTRLLEGQTRTLLSAIDEKFARQDASIDRKFMDFKSDLYGTFVKKEDFERHIAAGHV